MTRSRWERATDWVGDHLAAVSLCCGALVMAATFVADKAYDAKNWPLFWGAIPLGLAAYAVPACVASRNRLLMGRRMARDALRHVVELVARLLSAHDPKMDIRACVMRTRAGGARRQVDLNTAYGMSTHPDADLEMDYFAGVSGEALRERKIAVGDLTVALPANTPGWGLHPHERAKVRPDLKSILAAPILDPDDPRGLALGTLQVDSSDDMVRTRFDDQRSRANLQAAADLVSLIMKVGG